MPRAVHFEIRAGDPARAMPFHSGVFGWKFEKTAGPMDYRLINTGAAEEPGINGGLLRRMGPNPDPAAPTPVVGFVCAPDVADVDRTVAAATQAGGTVALPKMAIPGLALFAYL
jgi:predicted enzyme related to lactoylglutathione lyase